MRVADISKMLSVIRLRPFDTSTPEGQSKERYRLIALMAGSSIAAKMITIGTVLITVPLTLDYLGAERFGIWMTVSAMMTILSFADFGIGNGLTNIISESNGKDDRELARVAVSSSFFVLSLIALVLILAALLVIPLLPLQALLKLSSRAVADETAQAMLVLIVCLAINMPLGIIQKVQMGYQEGYKNNLWLIAGSLLGLMAVLTVVYFRMPVPWLVLAAFGAPVLAVLVNWIYGFFIARRWLRPAWSAASVVMGRRVVKAGLLFALMQLIAFLGPASDNFVVAMIFGPATVADYAVVSKLFSAMFIVQFLTAPLWPAFAEAIAAGDTAWARRTFRKAEAISLGLGIVLAVIFLFAGQTIIRLWVGAGHIPSMYLLAGFAGWIVVLSFYSPVSSLLSSGPFLKTMPRIYGTAAVLALTLKIILALVVGLPGVIFASVFAYGILALPALRTVNEALDKHESV